MSDEGLTTYSKEYKGNKRNYNQPVEFDVTDGYVRIVQKKANKEIDIVLLTPKQYKALVAFVNKVTP